MVSVLIDERSDTDASRWHILTAISGYFAVAIVDILVSGPVTDDPLQHLAWPLPSAASYMAGRTPKELRI